MSGQGNERTLYLPGLNGLRAIAALIVVIWHLDVFASSYFGLSPIGYGRNGMAGQAVTIFFVLSGFLITYLLLLEEEVHFSINIRNFYLRRILRIWPLYFLILAISVLIVLFLHKHPPESWKASLLMYTFFVPNLAYALDLKIIPAAPLWSVGVEEQFYLLWPFLLLNRNVNSFRNMLLVIIIYLGIKSACYFYIHFYGSAGLSGNIYDLIKMTRLDCMAIGGVGAYLYYKKNDFVRLIFHRYTQLASWIIFFASILYKPFLQSTFLQQEIYSLAYLVIIMNVSLNRDRIIGLEYPVFNFLGRISYGIYVYHFPILIVLSYALKPVFESLGLSWIAYALMYASVILTTIVVAKFSYEYFEKPMLKLKRRFSTVPTTN